MALFNPRYSQLLQQKGLLNNQQGDLYAVSGLSISNRNLTRTLNTTKPITPQVSIRKQGFGTQFADTPPPFIADKVDNKIERMNPPKPKKKRRLKSKNKK